MSSDERDLLRQHVLHGRTIDEIGAALGVHRGTAARRIARARETLLKGTRRRLMARLRVTRGELLHRTSDTAIGV